LKSGDNEKKPPPSLTADKNGFLYFLDSSGAHQSIPPEELSLSTMSLILLPDHNDKVNNSNETPAATLIT